MRKSIEYKTCEPSNQNGKIAIPENIFKYYF